MTTSIVVWQRYSEKKVFIVFLREGALFGLVSRLIYTSTGKHMHWRNPEFYHIDEDERVDFIWPE